MYLLVKVITKWDYKMSWFYCEVIHAVTYIKHFYCTQWSPAVHGVKQVRAVKWMFFDGFDVWLSLWIENCGLLYHYPKYAIMIWSYTRHVIFTNNHCWLVKQHPGEHDSSHAFAADFWFERYIRHIIYVFCTAFVDFVSCDVTVISSLKRFISRFLLPFVYIKEF